MEQYAEQIVHLYSRQAVGFPLLWDLFSLFLGKAAAIAEVEAFCAKVAVDPTGIWFALGIAGDCPQPGVHSRQSQTEGVAWKA